MTPEDASELGLHETNWEEGICARTLLTTPVPGRACEPNSKRVA